jgi:hypothetical protein
MHPCTHAVHQVIMHVMGCTAYEHTHQLVVPLACHSCCYSGRLASNAITTSTHVVAAAQTAASMLLLLLLL